MERKKCHKNELTQRDDQNPFDEIWFWLHLASISIECTDFMRSQDKHDVKQKHHKESKQPYYAP
jgi:fructose-1,6-bisphosphatase